MNTKNKLFSFITSAVMLLCIVLFLAACSGADISENEDEMLSRVNKTNSASETDDLDLDPDILNFDNDIGEYGELAYSQIVFLSQVIGSRPPGSDTERESADYIYTVLKIAGYDVSKQYFDFTGRYSSGSSSNVIANHPGNSNDKSGTLIIGAHYDSVASTVGAHDNASGVAVLLEVAERVSSLSFEYNLVFVAFGAEEVGLFGSAYYVSQLSEDEINSILSFINLDSVIGGDYLYIHGAAGENGWLRNMIYTRAEELGLNIRLQPGLNPDYPIGSNYPGDDTVSFNNIGIPYAYYESTNWEEDQLDEDMTGYVETVSEGAIWHTERDDLNFLEEAFPGRVQERLSNTVHSLVDILVVVYDRLQILGN